MTDLVAEFLDAELTPLVRRMTYRPPNDPEDDPAVREMVWQGLLAAGALDHPDPVRLAERLGSVLYQGPLLDTLTARAAGVSGDDPVVLAVREDGAANPAEPGAMTVDRDTVDAVRDHVGCAADATSLLVVGKTDTGVRLALVPRRHPGVALRRHEELGRGESYRLRLSRVPVTRWLDADWGAVVAGARVRHAAYLVGLAQAALDGAVAYAKTREQFGQPIGRFQWIGFRLAALTAQVEAVRLLVHDAGATTGDVRFAAAQALAAAAEVARTTATEALQVHGAAGFVDASDAQLHYRRAGVDALVWGTPTQLRADAAPLLPDRLTA